MKIDKTELIGLLLFINIVIPIVIAFLLTITIIWLAWLNDSSASLEIIAYILSTPFEKSTIKYTISAFAIFNLFGVILLLSRPSDKT